jgi:hypothetical protein
MLTGASSDPNTDSSSASPASGEGAYQRLSGLACSKVIGPRVCTRDSPRSQVGPASPSALRVAAAISSTTATTGCNPGDCFATPAATQVRSAFHPYCQPLPVELADTIDNLRGARTAVRQITAMQDHVGRGLFEIGENRLKCCSVAMDVGHDGDTHHNAPVARIPDVIPLSRRSNPRAPPVH